MLVKAPFTLPPDFLHSLGYRGGRRFVAIFWEPCGDESSYDDGRNSACGMTDNYQYLALVRQLETRAWLEENGIVLGDSERAAEHCLLIDACIGEFYACPWHEAQAHLARQSLLQ